MEVDFLPANLLNIAKNRSVILPTRNTYFMEHFLMVASKIAKWSYIWIWQFKVNNGNARTMCESTQN